MCFKCDQPYYVGHVCPNKELRVLTVLNGCEMELVETDLVHDFEDETGLVIELRELSLSSFLGLPSLTITKIKVCIGKTEMVVMLDSEVTHNFIPPSLVKRAHLKIVQEKNLDVLLETGVSVKGMEVCKKVKFGVKALDFSVDFIALDLGNVDIILGIQWLRSLGLCQMNWTTHELTFQYKGRSVTLCGDPSLHYPRMSLKSLEIDFRLQPKGLEMELCNTVVPNQEILNLPSQIEVVLHRFDTIFVEPTCLPPIRGREHAINLNAGICPISVRPYRYPHAHKEEMERLVKQMLEA